MSRYNIDWKRLGSDGWQSRRWPQYIAEPGDGWPVAGWRLRNTDHQPLDLGEFETLAQCHAAIRRSMSGVAPEGAAR